MEETNMINLKNGNKNSHEKPIEASHIGGRTKKEKIVFGPSENNLPKNLRRTLRMLEVIRKDLINDNKNIDTFYVKKISKPHFLLKIPCKLVKSNQMKNDKCTICSNNTVEKQMTCVKCNRKAHVRCLKRKFKNVKLLEKNWHCNFCSLCSACSMLTKEKLLTCHNCGKLVHMSCQYQNINKNVDIFECSDCIYLYNSDKSILPRLPTVLENEVGSFDDDPLIRYYNLRTWTIDQVSNYIARYFPIQADIFRDNEIDGLSLLLMKRSDIMKLPIKLGPALCIYSLIVCLKEKCNDPKLTWT